MSKRQRAYKHGLRAEKIAALYLRLKGYRIFAERERIMQGEIDIVALKKNTLAVVEVKARKTLAECEQSITPMKQQKITKALEHLISGSGRIAALANRGRLDIRFDAIWIVPGHLPRHVKDAWRI